MAEKSFKYGSNNEIIVGKNKNYILGAKKGKVERSKGHRGNVIGEGGPL